MKQLRLMALALAILTAFGACEKTEEDITPPVVETDIFIEPFTDWSLTKQQVKSKESRILTDETTPDEIVMINQRFESKGDGSITYSDTCKIINNIQYGFYSNAKTLVFCYVGLKYNPDYYTRIKEWLIKKHGGDYILDIGFKELGDTSESEYYIWKTNKVVTEFYFNKDRMCIRYYKPSIYK